MAMGMPRDEYWNGNIFAALDYYEAYTHKRKIDNEQAWLQGLYIYDAVGVAIAKGFGGDVNAEYATEPFPFFLDNEEKENKEAERESAEMLQAKVYMQQMVDVGKSWSKDK